MTSIVMVEQLLASMGRPVVLFLAVCCSLIISSWRTSLSMASVASTPAAAPARRRLGFLGVGTMNSAIIRGLCRPSEAAPGEPAGTRWVEFPLYLSPRGAAKASDLARELGPSLVTVCSSNEALLEAADVVVLGLTPPVTREVVPRLRFRREQLVLSLVSTVTSSQLEALAGLPAGTARKAVPLPPVAKHRGVAIVCPPDPFVSGLFRELGTVVEVQAEEQLQALLAATSSMGPFYQQVLTLQRWLAEHGVSDAEAAAFAGALYGSVAIDSAAPSGGADLAALVAEQTPGGLNAEAVQRLTAAGVYESQRAALDAILLRIRTAAGTA